jgi:hypothetical protein
MVSFRQRVTLASVVAIVAAACSDATAPGPLDVSVALARSTIVRGDTTHLTATIRNISTRSVTFNNVCAFDVRGLPVAETPDLRPRQRVCIAIYAPVTLAPSETVVWTLRFDATAEQCSGPICRWDHLPPGNYRVWGVLNYAEGPGVSAPVPLRIE